MRQYYTYVFVADVDDVVSAVLCVANGIFENATINRLCKHQRKHQQHSIGKVGMVMNANIFNEKNYSQFYIKAFALVVL